jgi:hypothetical protein
MITLQGPDKTYTLKTSLKLIAAVEADYGSLYALADDLLEKTLPLSEMVDIVKVLYRHAGCAKSLDDFLLQQPCTEILITFLMEAIGPVERAGAALPPGIMSPPSKPFLDDMVKQFPDEKSS